MTSIGPYVGKLKRQLQTREEQESPLNAARIEEAWGRAGHTWRACFWTPAVTVLTFLRQVLHGNCSCRQAVAMTLAQALSQELAQGGGPSDSMSGESGAYSQARQHLPRSVFEEVNAWAIGSWNRSRRAGMPCPTAPTAKNLASSNAATKSFRTSNAPEKLPE